ncbi:Protein CBR-glrx-10 [Parelaphostrongylus tenuis]|uniref:Protein CBR-glrx-10 n=1 Tax=Parelaphostrongylus tenuis TaxID=148309 RepID=A0AAD5QH53_PARTN|nr:Protein CBR-glrx-10 [Parelaphostrongylus tenuis]
MGGAKDFVNGLIMNHKVVIFGKSDCPYSHKAKDAIEAQHIKSGAMECVEIDKRPDFSEIKDYMKELTGAPSTPRVFINGKFFGGGDDTVEASKNGKLAQVLKEAQAI